MSRIRIIAVLLAAFVVLSCAAMEQKGKAAFRGQNSTTRDLTSLNEQAYKSGDTMVVEALDSLEQRIHTACAALQQRGAEVFSGEKTCFLHRVWLNFKALITTERCIQETEEVDRELSSPPYARKVLVRVP